jgi:hypothetical protein
MARDVFISYSTQDRPVAEKVCAALEEGGIKCWIAPRDVPFGADYEEAIVDGIASSRLLVLVLSSHSNASPHVKREIQNACAGYGGKPIIPLRIEEIEYNKALRYYLGSTQWLDASTPPLEQHLGRLVEYVRTSLASAGAAAPPERPAPPADARTTATAAADTPRASDVTPRSVAETPRAADEPRITDAPRAHDDARDSAPPSTARRPSPAVWIGAGVLALVLIGVLVVVFALRPGGGDTNMSNVNAVNANANYASPTPQHTPTPQQRTPTPTPAPTPRILQPSRNLNLNRRIRPR